MLNISYKLGLLKILFKPIKITKTVRCAGIDFPNIVGLAAGLDKNAIAFKALSTLGFGHIEVGTITPKSQPGNEYPRLFRLKKDKALINRMGFNNDGITKIKNRLESKGNTVVGINIGKNKLTPIDSAHEDYFMCFKELYYSGDYFVINVSSPNTPQLRELQGTKHLEKICNPMFDFRAQKEIRKPVFLKIAPDIQGDPLKELISFINKSEIDGLIISNTSIQRPDLQTSKQKIKQIGNGGLSGAPIFALSTELLRSVRKQLRKDIPIIGVGGIDSGEKAVQKLEAGANLIQIYTGFIYRGPRLINEILKSV